MNKRLIILLVLASILISFSACGKENKESTNIQESADNQTVDDATTDTLDDTTDSTASSEENADVSENEAVSEVNDVLEDVEISEEIDSTDGSEAATDRNAAEAVDILIPKVQIGSESLERLNTVNNLIEAGWEIDEYAGDSGQISAIPYHISLEEVKKFTFKDNMRYAYRMTKTDSENNELYLWVEVHTNVDYSNEPLNSYIASYKFDLQENRGNTFMGLSGRMTQEEIDELFSALNCTRKEDPYNDADIIFESENGNKIVIDYNVQHDPYIDAFRIDNNDAYALNEK